MSQKRPPPFVVGIGASAGRLEALEAFFDDVPLPDTETAQFDGMPRTARDANVATFVLGPQEMPHVLVEHCKTDGASTTSTRTSIACARAATSSTCSIAVSSSE